jgi:voltage-gated potassium channel
MRSPPSKIRRTFSRVSHLRNPVANAGFVDRLNPLKSKSRRKFLRSFAPVQSPLRRIFIGGMFFGSTLIAAIVGYTLLGCPILTSIYMVVITIFGVGYGEACPVNEVGDRIFTMAVIIAGTSSAVYTVGGFFQMLAEGELHQALDSRRKTKDIERLRQHILICGFGRIGQVLATRLLETQEAFVIIDNNSERIAKAEAQGLRVYQGNATDEETLIAAGIRQAKVLATVLPDDAANVFITLTAKELNPKLMVVARGELPSTEKKLRLAGADHVILPANISGARMANLITQPSTVEFLDGSEEWTRLSELLAQIDVQVEELQIPISSPLVGRQVGDLELRGKGTFIVVALKKVTGELLTHPDRHTQLDGGDTVIVLGHRGDMPWFAQSYDVRGQR